MKWSLFFAAILIATTARADDLSHANTWSALATDRVARNVGDSLTVIVYENATATNTAENSANRASAFNGQISAGNPSLTNGLNEQASLGLTHTAHDQGSTTRAGTMLAEISVAVDAILPNGDLHVTGVQVVNVGGEHTRIAVKGHVRAADISSANVILSTNLADASIEYDGEGFVSDSSRPGLLSRALNWIGLP